MWMSSVGQCPYRRGHEQTHPVVTLGDGSPWRRRAPRVSAVPPPTPYAEGAAAAFSRSSFSSCFSCWFSSYISRRPE